MTITHPVLLPPFQPSQDPAAALLSILAEDIFGIFPFDWLVAWQNCGSSLVPVCSHGDCPDPAASHRAASALVDPFAHASTDWRLDSTFRPAFASAVRAFQRFVGVVTAGVGSTTPTCSDRDLQSAEQFCHQMGRVLENPSLTERMVARFRKQERTTRELSAAREVQNRFLPARFCAMPGIDYFGECRPCTELGGDFFDFHRLPDGTLAVALGDVFGKGVPSALIVACLQTALRELHEESMSPAAIVTELNRLTCGVCPESFYATLFYARLDPINRRMSYINAGHELPLILRHGSGVCVRPDASGPVLGLSRRVQYKTASAALEPGDLLLALTDGITEAENAYGEQYPVSRILETIGSSRRASARDIALSCLEDVDRYISRAEPSDDRTIVVARLSDGPRESLFDLSSAALSLVGAA